MSFICPVCTEKWKTGQKSIQCTSCQGWVHHNNRKNCSGLTNSEFVIHSNEIDKPWDCDKCVAKSFIVLPFANNDENDWLNFNPNTKLSDDIKIINAVQVSDLISKCDTAANNIVMNNDVDDHVPCINSKYYDIEQINSLKLDKPSSFGLFHVNIASLEKHFDDLNFVLSKLNHKFDIIGISEHKIRKGTSPSTNINIKGYNEFIFEPTETTHGGTGFYIKDNIDYVIRNDLNFNLASNFETMFIEVQIPNKKNLVVGCIYRHPSSNISIKDFTNIHLDPILEVISSENKQCVLMGDFNINLLKCNTNTDANLFYNTLSDHFFTPFILQPTRLHSNTLIDNIYLNSLEYQSTSGNILIELSDHLIQFLILEGFTKNRTIPEINLFKRDFSNFNEREFRGRTFLMGTRGVSEICKTRETFRLPS